MATPAKTLNALLHMPAQMELSQIELIYRAEGNANLVLALPQFKKVLRLPKMICHAAHATQDKNSNCQPTAAAVGVDTAGGTARPEGEANVSDPAKASSTSPAGALTMPDFMAYIEIMRRLLGNEFVCAADIVAIPKEADRYWINEHIRPHRPVARLDKEFVGPFGLMLPDVTQLPATFDVLLANLQAKDMNTDMNVDICTGSSSSSSWSCATKEQQEEQQGIQRVGDTYAIEIKPKQGWLQLPSDVSDLFDLMPEGSEGQTIDPSAQLTSCNPTRLEGKCRCRYCSMQQLKLQTGKIKRLSDYCPLELFSGSPRRMFAALDALFACPQNNLRVFQAGNLIYGDHANSISCDELQTRLFPGEIMALIKHLLVACLLREYQSEEQAEGQQQQQQQEESKLLAKNVAAFGESSGKRCGSETKATATTTEIGAANADAAAAAEKKEEEEEQEQETQQEQVEPGIVECVKAVAGQPQRRSTSAAAVEKATQRYTKRCRMAAAATATTTSTTTTSTTGQTTNAPTSVSTNVTAVGKETEMPDKSQAEISKAEIFHLPKNCVLQKILHLQLLVKHHFHYMWQAGHAHHATPSYAALHALLSRQLWHDVDQLDAEQAYMLGATALDCSIMLTFQEIRCQSARRLHNSSLQPWLVTLQGRQFLTKLSVLDLDPKPDSHFHKFIKQARQIEKCCRALN